MARILTRIVDLEKEKIILFASLITIFLLLFFNLELYDMLRYSRTDILSGELWRLVTCHFVHLNVYHGIFNIVALIIILYALGEVLSAVQWLLITSALCLMTSLGLLILSEDVVSYVGLSGILHGMFSFLVIVFCIRESKLYGLLLLGLVVKLVREQLPGFDIYHMSDLIGGAVIVDGHLYGALSGGALALGFVVWKNAKVVKST